MPSLYLALSVYALGNILIFSLHNLISFNVYLLIGSKSEWTNSHSLLNTVFVPYNAKENILECWYFLISFVFRIHWWLSFRALDLWPQLYIYFFTVWKKQEKDLWYQEFFSISYVRGNCTGRMYFLLIASLNILRLFRFNNIQFLLYLKCGS